MKRFPIALLALLLAALAACGAAPAASTDSVGTAVAQTVAAAAPTAAAEPTVAAAEPTVAAAEPTAAAAPAPATGVEIPLAVGPTATTVTGQTITDGPPALYRLDLPGGSVATFDLQLSGENDRGEYMLTRDGDKVFGYDFYGGSQTISERQVLNTAAGGTYLLRVEGGATYSLTVAATLQQDGGAEGDASDDKATAHEVALGAQEYAGQLGALDPTDYYRFRVPAGSTVDLKVQFDDEEIRSDEVQILAGGDVFVSAPPVLDANTWAPRWTLSGDLPEQEYVLKVTEAASYTFQIRTTPQQDGGAEGDAGDDEATAREVAPGAQEYAGQLGTLDPTDYYRFRVPAGSTVDLKVQFDDKEIFADEVQILAGGDVLISAPPVLDSNSWSMSWALSGDVPEQEYFLKITKVESYRFTFAITPQQDGGAPGDAGDSEATARDLALAQQITGRVSGHDPHDYYRFTLNQPATLVIKGRVPDQQGGDFNLSIWREGSELGDSSVSAGNPAQLSSDGPLPAGTYFLVIKGSGQYQVELMTE